MQETEKLRCRYIEATPTAAAAAAALGLRHWIFSSLSRIELTFFSRPCEIYRLMLHDGEETLYRYFFLFFFLSPCTLAECVIVGLGLSNIYRAATGSLCLSRVRRRDIYIYIYRLGRSESFLSYTRRRNEARFFFSLLCLNAARVCASFCLVAVEYAQ